MRRYLVGILTLISAILILPFFALAHNGERALALPLEGIVVDGNSSDWPSNFTKYPITRNSPDDKEDCSGHFRIGYNLAEKSLYVIVEVQDDEHVLSSEFGSKQFDQDANWLFLDLKHETKGSGVAFYALSENSLRLLQSPNSWDKSIRDCNLNGVSHAVSRKGKTTTYEWKIDLGDELYTNRTIGLDHQIVDVDEGGSSVISWGIFGGKNSISNNLGDVFIVGENEEEWGSLKGTAQLEEPFSDVVPYGLEIANLDNPALWTQFPLLAKKDFEIKLPPGKYNIKSALIGNVTPKDQYLSSRDGEGIVIQIEPGKHTIAPLYRVKAQSVPAFFSSKKGILPDFKERDSSKIDGFFKDLIHFYTIPGLSLALVKDGKVVYAKNYGESNAYENEAVSKGALFDAGSVTKPVFAFLVMKLVEEGRIDLDQPLYKYLPYEDIAHDTAYHQLTARLVLSHRTGFPNWRWGQLNFVNPPGTFGYSGEGIVYLSKVIEKVTDQDLETLLEEYILEPLEIRNTYFSHDKDLLEKLTHGHDDKYSSLVRPPETPNMAFSMHTNAEEFSKFMIALLNRELLSEKTYDEMFAKQVDIPTNWSEANTDWKQGFGLGYQLKYSPFGLAYGHSGRNGGYDCSFEVYDDLGVGYVFFTNSSNGFRIKNAIREFLISGNVR